MNAFESIAKKIKDFNNQIKNIEEARNQIIDYYMKRNMTGNASFNDFEKMYREWEINQKEGGVII